MERSDIRDYGAHGNAVPGFRCAKSGLRLLEDLDDRTKTSMPFSDHRDATSAARRGAGRRVSNHEVLRPDRRPLWHGFFIVLVMCAARPVPKMTPQTVIAGGHDK
jgi:hypothetical protein